MEQQNYLPIKVLHDFVNRIENLGIQYMLTGSMAMMKYAMPRYTMDIDVVIELEPKDILRIIETLEPDYYVPHEALKRAIYNKGMFNIIHQDSSYKVDCVIKKNTEFQKTAFEKRQNVDYYGRNIWIITKDDLIISKLWWARESHSELQMRDVKNLMRVWFDSDYVEKWARELGAFEVFLNCKRDIEQ